MWRQGSGGIRGRLIDRSGTPLGADFNVSDEGIRPKVGVTDTGFVVIIDMTTYIAFVLLDANGNDIGGEGLNVTFPSNSINPDLARLADGSFVVVWTASSSPHDNSDYSIRARALSSAGQPVGDEIGINLVTAGRQEFAAVAASKSSGFLVVWQSGNEIRSRRFT